MTMVCFLGCSVQGQELDSMIPMGVFQLSGFYEILRSLQAFFQWSFMDHFAPSFISSLGLTFHSMLYLSLPDLILFPGIPYVLFMLQWLRNKWESGQSFVGSSSHSASLLSWTQQRFVSLGNLVLLWGYRAVSVSHTEKGACSVLWDVAVGAWKTSEQWKVPGLTALRIFSVKILYS